MRLLRKLRKFIWPKTYTYTCVYCGAVFSSTDLLAAARVYRDHFLYGHPDKYVREVES